MQLKSARLLFRPVTAADTEDLFRIYGDPATNRYNPAGPYPSYDYAASVMERWLTHWRENGFGHWAIVLQASPRDIMGFGGLSIRRVNTSAINNLGYRFATQTWGKGLATEFARYTVRYGFAVLKLSEISALVRENHLASQRVLEKSGLRQCGKIKDIDNAPASLLFRLTADEWRQGEGHNAYKPD